MASLARPRVLLPHIQGSAIFLRPALDWLEAGQVGLEVLRHNKHIVPEPQFC